MAQSLIQNLTQLASRHFILGDNVNIFLMINTFYIIPILNESSTESTNVILSKAIVTVSTTCLAVSVVSRPIRHLISPFDQCISLIHHGQDSAEVKHGVTKRLKNHLYVHV
jgi:hypothetical protein